MKKTMREKKKHGKPGEKKEKTIVLDGKETIKLFEEIEFRKNQGRAPYDPLTNKVVYYGDKK